jgi:hypothetical protein
VTARQVLAGTGYAVAGLLGVAVAPTTAGCRGGGRGALSTAIALETTSEAPEVPSAIATRTLP